MQFYFISHHFHGPNSGGEVYNFTLVNTLINEKHPVRIFVDSDIPTFFKRNYLLYNLWFLLKLSQFNSGILYIDSYMHPRLFLFIAVLKRTKKTKVLGTVHHLFWPLQKSKPARVIDKKIEGFFISQLDYIIVPSDYTRQSINEFISLKNQVFLLYPGVECRGLSGQRQVNKRDVLDFLFVGSVECRKGLDYLIKAVVLLRDRRRIQVHIAGDKNKEPEYYQQLLDLIRKHELVNITFHGRVDDSELDALYQSADVFVFPTLHEGYGIAVVEALCYQLPVIASHVTTMPELIRDQANGLLVPPRDEQALAEAMETLINEPERRQKMIDANKNMSDRFYDWDGFNKECIKMINRIITPS